MSVYIRKSCEFPSFEVADIVKYENGIDWRT